MAFLKSTAARDERAFDQARELARAVLDGGVARLARAVLDGDERFALTNACELAERIIAIARATGVVSAA